MCLMQDYGGIKGRFIRYLFSIIPIRDESAH